MGRRHYTPAELCQMAKKSQQNKVSAFVVPWSVCAILATDNLLRNEGWKAKRLNNYLQKQKEYHEKFDTDNEQWKIQQKRLIDFAGEELNIMIENFPSEKDIPKDIKKGSFLYQLELKEIDNSKTILLGLVRGLLSHYNALIDLKFSKNKLINNKNQMQKYIDDYTNGTGKPIKEMRQYILEETGLFIEIMDTVKP